MPVFRACETRDMENNAELVHSVIELPKDAQVSVVAGLDVADCIRVSIALGPSPFESSSAGIAAGLLPLLKDATFPPGQQPCANVCMELSALRTLELTDVEKLEPTRFLALRQLEALKVSGGLSGVHPALDLHQKGDDSSDSIAQQHEQNSFRSSIVACSNQQPDTGILC